MRNFIKHLDPKLLSSNASGHPPEPILHICEADFNLTELSIKNRCTLTINETSMLNYLSEGRYKEDGYSHVIFNGFDFTQSRECNYILPLVCNDFRFVQAKLTIEQVENLLQKDFDLSSSDYYISLPIKPGTYKKLHELCGQKNFENALQGVSVDFSNYDITLLPDNFVSSCKPFSLHQTTITQAQFDLCINTIRKINLMGLNFKNLDISLFIKLYNFIIGFNQREMISHGRYFCVDNTSIHQAVMDIETLATLAVSEKYYPWFQKENLTIILKLENGLQYDFYEIDINSFVLSLNSQKQTPRLYAASNFFIKLHEEISAKNPRFTILNFSKMRSGEQFLWAAFAAFTLPHSTSGKIFWRTVDVKLEPTCEHYLST